MMAPMESEDDDDKPSPKKRKLQEEGCTAILL